METLNQISIESFSYSWLNNINPSIDFNFDQIGESLRHSSDKSSFIEINPDFFSIRWTEFDFPLPEIPKSSDLVHADQIFSNGRLLPFCNSNKNDSDNAKKLMNEGNFCESDCSSYSMLVNGDSRKLNLGLSRGRRKSTGKILRKYLNFLIPLYRIVLRLKMMPMRRNRSGGDSSIREFSIVDRNRVSRGFDWEFECCIRDAVLHCKKSIAED